VITCHARALGLELSGQYLPLWVGELVSGKPAGSSRTSSPSRTAWAADAGRIADRIHEVSCLGLADDQLPGLTPAWACDRVTSWISDLDAFPSHQARRRRACHNRGH
jgi:hypothetical protein